MEKENKNTFKVLCWTLGGKQKDFRLSRDNNYINKFKFSKYFVLKVKLCHLASESMHLSSLFCRPTANMLQVWPKMLRYVEYDQGMTCGQYPDYIHCKLPFIREEELHLATKCQSQRIQRTILQSLDGHLSSIGHKIC